MSPRLPLLLAFLPLLPLLSAIAQERRMVGLGAHYEFGPVRSGSIDPGWGGLCNCPGEGELTTATSWWSVAFLQPEGIGPSLGWSGRFGFGVRSAEFLSYSSSTSIAPDPPPAGTTTRFESTSSTVLLRGDVSVVVDLAGGAYLQLGGWTHLPLGTSVRGFERILSPVGATYGNGSTSHAIDEATLLPRRVGHAGLLVGTGMELELGPRATLHPEVTARADLLPLGDDPNGTQGFLFNIGTTLYFELLPPSAPPSPPPATPPPPPVASVHLRTAGSEGGEIVAERRVVHVLQIVPFPETITGLAPDTTADWSPQRLARRDPERMSDVAVDLLGWRAARAPATTIRLTHGSDASSREFARSIRSHLAGRWLPASRISLREEGAPGVRWSGTSSELVAPIRSEWLEEEYRLPALRVEPRIESAAGVARWEAAILCDGDTCARVSSDDPPDRSLEVVIPPATTTRVLETILVVTDTLGRSGTATDRLPLRVVGTTGNAPTYRRVIIAGASAGDAAAVSRLAGAWDLPWERQSPWKVVAEEPVARESQGE